MKLPYKTLRMNVILPSGKPARLIALFRWTGWTWGQIAQRYEEIEV